MMRFRINWMRNWKTGRKTGYVRPSSGGVWMTLPGLEHVWNAFQLCKEAINGMSAFCYEKA